MASEHSKSFLLRHEKSSPQTEVVRDFDDMDDSEHSLAQSKGPEFHSTSISSVSTQKNGEAPQTTIHYATNKNGHISQGSKQLTHRARRGLPSLNKGSPSSRFSHY